jgi:hypothetical protein
LRLARLYDDELVTPPLLLLLALDPEAVRAAMPVEVIEAPKTFAVCGDSIQVIDSLPAPVDEASVRLCAFASGVSRFSAANPGQQQHQRPHRQWI